MEIQVFRNANNSQTNAYSHYSNYSYSGLIPNERVLKDSSSTSRIDFRRKETRTSIGSILGLVTLLKKPRKPAHPNSSKFQPAQWLAVDQDDQGQVEGVVNSIFVSNDLSDNCLDEISHSNDLDAVVESESHCQIMSLPQVNRIFLRFVVVSLYGMTSG